MNSEKTLPGSLPEAFGIWLHRSKGKSHPLVPIAFATHWGDQEQSRPDVETG